MIRKRLFFILIISLALYFIGCKESYLPPAIEEDLHYLVVDGTLINGPDSTFIRLSRTSKLYEDVLSKGEKNARVSIEDTNGRVMYYFTQLNSSGDYAVPGMLLNINEKYRLRIQTANGDQYLSDEIIVKDTPPIDSVNWQKTNDGVTIYVNTHDPAKNTIYYRWEYIETYDYFSHDYSDLKYNPNGTTLVEMFPWRDTNELIYHCWRTNYSTQIFPGSSARLAEDRISFYQLRFIHQNTIEISNIYSMLVKQYALTKEAFEYYQNLKKILEQSGSLFDPQPSQLPGNIHCLNRPDESVLGFLTASSVQQKRIFIKTEEVQPWLYFSNCESVYIVPAHKDSIQFFFGSSLLIPVGFLYAGGVIAAISGGAPSCVDCRLKGGTTVKPSFWP